MPKKRCNFCKKKKSFIVSQCNHCKKYFCLSHIHEFSHVCKNYKKSPKPKIILVNSIPKKIKKI